jgi:cytochrome c554/c'-like protein/doubled CXXCH motif protein
MPPPRVPSALVLMMMTSILAPACGPGEPTAPSTPQAPEGPPAQPVRAGFVGSAACVDCHADQHETWSVSAHAHSLREATPDTVLGRFDGQPFRDGERDLVPYRLGDEFFIRIEGAGGAAKEHRVTRVIGRTFEQGYLAEGASGRWILMPLSWSIERKEWDATHRVLQDMAGNAAPGSMRDTDSIQVVQGCGQCHATGFDPGHDPKTGRLAPTFVEGAVSCETCHGPGAAHVAFHEEGHGPDAPVPTRARLVHPAELTAPQVMESCGRCHFLHEWRAAIDDDPRVGHSDIAISRNGHERFFFADGRLAGLGYHGTTQSESRCHLEGDLSCLECHDLHGGRQWALRYEATSDEQCSRCHADLVKAPQQHSHHQETTCVDCHMPKQLTGVLHFQRDHSLGSPEPELRERYGDAVSPDACGLCHKDQDAAWAREWKDRWWKPAARRVVEDVGLVVQLRRDPLAPSAERLQSIALDKTRRPFLRLTALAALDRRPDGWSKAWLAAVEISSDPNAQIRQAAVEVLTPFKARSSDVALRRRLTDDVRTIRVGAAYALAVFDADAGPVGYGGALADALRMLDRQVLDEAALERVLAIADAADAGDVFAARYAEWRALVWWEAPKWTDGALDVVIRAARRALDAGRAGEARTLLEHARSRRTPPGAGRQPWYLLDAEAVLKRARGR